MNIQHLTKELDNLRNEVSKVIIGRKKSINALLRTLICNSTVLLDGPPGSGKSLMVKTLANSITCEFSDKQVKPLTLLEHINLSDKKILYLTKEKKFILFATLYPIIGIELKNHELDLFMFMIKVKDLTFKDELDILNKTPVRRIIKKTISRRKLKEIQEASEKIFADEKIKEYIVRIIDATRNPEKYKLTTSKFINQGSSTRGSIFLYKAAKAEALLQGRNFVIPSDVKAVSPDILRHRIILNYQGILEEVNTDLIIEEIMKKTPIP